MPPATTVPATPGVLLPLEPAECLRLLAGCSYGRVAFTHRALPVVLPVNFLLVEDAVLLRVRAGSALSGSAKGDVVAFQADDIDPHRHTGWTVTAVGRADVVGAALRARALRELQPWARGERDHVVRIALEQVSGRRLEVPAT